MTWWKRKSREDELERELRGHLEMEAEELQQEGASPAEAQLSARRLFGNLTCVQEEVYEMWTWMWLDHLLRDLRYGWRGLKKSPVFTVTAALSIALGTGAPLIVYGLLDSAFFNSVTARDVARLKKIEFDGQRFSYLQYEQLSTSAPLLAGLAAYDRTNLSFSSGDELKSVAADIVSGNFFEVLGVAPMIGRTFTGDELKARSQPRVLVLSHGFWQREFRGDMGVLGRPVQVNREPFTVIGVLPPGYRSIHGYGITPDVYTPISSLVLGELDRPDNQRLQLICRLQAEASRQQAETALRASAERWNQQFPAEINRKHQVWLSPLTGFERLRNDGVPMEMALFLTSLILSGALVLLIACGNAGSLLLARGAKRSREFAVRQALGAPKLHLLRQLFVETFLLAVLGSGFGLVLYLAASSLIDKAQPSLSLPVEVHLHLDVRIFALAASLALLATLLAGLTPAMQVGQRYSLVSARQVGGALRLRQLLVVSQFAFAFVLLVSAALLLRHLARIAVVDPGFDAKLVLLADPSLHPREHSRQHSQQYLRAALAELGRLPGVRSVSGASTIPLGLEHSVMSMRVGARIRVVPRVHTNSVTADYFRTMGIRLVQGRQFDETDREGGRPVAIVNESFARSYLENQPLNAGILVPQRVPGQPEPKFVGVVVVGVVSDSKYGTLGEDPMPALYWPWTQQYAPLTILIQSDSRQSIQLAVRNALARIGGQVPIKLQLMEERIAGALLPSRIASGLLGAIGTLGLILAAVGIYGVMAYSVGQRGGEIGLRLALGATPMQVLQMTLRDALRLTVIGLLLGLGLALLATRLLSGILASGMSAIDPLSLGSVGVLLSLTALGAALVPSWRASRVDPAVALRSE